MDMRKYGRRSAFIKADQVRDQPRDETITFVKIGRFDRPDVAFESGKQLTLNATNVDVLIEAYGDSDNWIGKHVRLFLGDIEYQGSPHEAVLVRPISPPIKQKREAKAADDESPFNDEVPF